MTIEVPDTLIEQKFFQHAGRPSRNSRGDMMGSCPFCLEGKSWGKKRRFNYYSDKKILMCYNCGETMSAVTFLQRVENKTFGDVLREIKDEGGDLITSENLRITPDLPKPQPPQLPPDVVNIFDDVQMDHYKDDYYIQMAVDEAKRRRLHTAVNRSELYVSPDDFVHKNRLIIPFHKEGGELTYYQSRAQTKKQMEMGKYLSCVNGKKSFYGIDKLDPMEPDLFVIEGPLDCFFVKNSIGGGGTKLNEHQQGILQELEQWYDVVYCLDNDFDNPDVAKIYLKLIKDGKRIFLWGGEFGDYKDFNEYTIDKGLDVVPKEKILAHVYTGKDAMKLFLAKKPALGKT